MQRYLYSLAVQMLLYACQLASITPGAGNRTTGDSSRPSMLAATIPGDIILGGLFPAHKKSEDALVQCGEIQVDRGIQRIEAMLFTIDEINRERKILPDLTLGANLLDTCSRDTYALEQSLEYVRASMNTLDASQFECKDGSTAKSKNSPMAVVGVVGGSYSGVSIQVANLLRLFKIPQISYASTSSALSDKTRFEYFARTVPPDNFQARAMVDIAVHFNWTYVSTIYSESDYGETGMDEFLKEAKARNICIAASEKISHSATPDDLDEIILSLKKKSNARVVILFVRVEDARNFLLAAKRQNITEQFVWVASDGWGINQMPVRNNEYVAQGALTIELQTAFISEFDKYFKRLRPHRNKRNPWFLDFWEHIHKCKFNITEQNIGKAKCTGQEKLNPRIYKQESKVQFIYDAVYAMAYGLKNMLIDVCVNFTTNSECIQEKNLDGALFYQYILNVSYEDRYGGVVVFDKQGDGLGRYNILNYRRNRSTRRYEYVPVGRWANGLQMEERIIWAGGTYDIPTSQCSKPCKPGEIKNVRGDSCCWICMPCRPWQYVKDEFTCEDCLPGWWPLSDGKGCYELEKKTLKWDTVFAIVPICLSCVGVMLTSVVIATFVKFYDTPIVKASGRELSFMLLSGFLLCYSMTFILLLKPSPIVCALQRFGVGFGFSVTYSSLLTKTNRISRIFDSASKSAKRPAFISPKSQLVISLILISFQIALTFVWFFLEPPGIKPQFLNERRDQVILKCKIKDISFLISLTYNMFLIIICTVYAVKTRKIPENFNESKFIGFTMYTTCIIWLAFVPIYFGTLNSFEIQTTTLCVSISLSASVALLCLFTPKMYIIVFQPEKNVRKLTMNSATYKKAATSSSISVPTSNHGEYGMVATNAGCHQERIKMRCPNSPIKMGGGTTETETDKDSMASLMFDECPQEETKS